MSDEQTNEAPGLPDSDREGEILEFVLGGPIQYTRRDLVEKTGRKLGRFEILTLRLDVRAPDGTHVATCSPAIILPRR